MKIILAGFLLVSIVSFGFLGMNQFKNEKYPDLAASSLILKPLQIENSELPRERITDKLAASGQKLQSTLDSFIKKFLAEDEFRFLFILSLSLFFYAVHIFARRLAYFIKRRRQLQENQWKVRTTLLVANSFLAHCQQLEASLGYIYNFLPEGYKLVARRNSITFARILQSYERIVEEESERVEGDVRNLPPADQLSERLEIWAERLKLISEELLVLPLKARVRKLELYLSDY